jgi:spore germination protein YaaH
MTKLFNPKYYNKVVIFILFFLLLLTLCAAYFREKQGKTLHVGTTDKSSGYKSVNERRHKPLPVRAAFYEPTDEQSYLSLKKNISKVNLIVTEYMFIDPKSDTIYVNPDFKGEEVIRASGVKVIAMLSNFYDEDFNGQSVHRILHDPEKRERLIDDIVNTVQSRRFSGVNIDFEELMEETDEKLIQFMKELYGRLHPLGLLVTIDVQPFNDDFNIVQLARYNDYLFLMAYDEHNNDTGPGPISSRQFISSALKEMTKNISGEQVAGKVILCVAGYGYDWPHKKKGITVSYQRSLHIARVNRIKVDCNEDAYNPNYCYINKSGIKHITYFTDAPTSLNTMRFASVNGLAGVALWRFGLEDPRLWDFYNKDLIGPLGDLSRKAFY